ncbi:charged multivesicular body protein 2a [Aspergillus terreus NIH2624]|uniref:Charged multivesicular body protein 2a n=1 Tax=Aspergillus terreus (strain NIH 2624 / FGSC A1156) TaxID=341663 RepID=Q0CJG7_ASPTN|nr:charged multivesicular body protein 2a [Aspergillus terreus NIH2624]EAU33928.1 charged multivesicular body protein 2a [Aspergillus terreus NIH2624]
MNIVEWAFGKRMTPAERLRKHQRALDRTQRELDRERVKLENQEKKLVQDIKKSAKNGQVGACKIQAKDLVRTRRLFLFGSRWALTPLTPPSLVVHRLTCASLRADGPEQ